MAIQIGATQAKAKLLSLLDDVEAGEEIEITRHGKVIARLSPARGPKAIKGMFEGVVWTADPEDELFSAGMEWEMDRPE